MLGTWYYTRQWEWENNENESHYTECHGNENNILEDKHISKESLVNCKTDNILHMEH